MSVIHSGEIDAKRALAGDKTQDLTPADGVFKKSDKEIQEALEQQLTVELMSGFEF